MGIRPLFERNNRLWRGLIPAYHWRFSVRFITYCYQFFRNFDPSLLEPNHIYNDYQRTNESYNNDLLNQENGYHAVFLYMYFGRSCTISVSDSAVISYEVEVINK